MQHEKGRAALYTAGAFLLSGLLWTAAMVLFGFYPFGESSILITDIWVPVCRILRRVYPDDPGGGTACSSPGIRGWA